MEKRNKKSHNLKLFKDFPIEYRRKVKHSSSNSADTSNKITNIDQDTNLDNISKIIKYTQNHKENYFRVTDLLLSNNASIVDLDKSMYTGTLIFSSSLNDSMYNVTFVPIGSLDTIKKIWYPSWTNSVFLYVPIVKLRIEQLKEDIYNNGDPFKLLIYDEYINFDLEKNNVAYDIFLKFISQCNYLLNGKGQFDIAWENSNLVEYCIITEFNKI